jgi:hypothetical protein
VILVLAIGFVVFRIMRAQAEKRSALNFSESGTATSRPAMTPAMFYSSFVENPVYSNYSENYNVSSYSQEAGGS